MYLLQQEKFEQFTKRNIERTYRVKRTHYLIKSVKNANYLVNNDINSNSSKNKFAKEHNISIISEKELIELLNPYLNKRFRN